jgi:Sulfotransferase family
VSSANHPSAAQLLAEASEAVDRSDLGPGDFRVGLDALLASLERDGDLAPSAAAKVTGDLRRRLTNRLDVEAWYEDHPVIDALPVDGPIDINGLPRTGTTALANMLSLDPQFRCLRGWEQASPCPPPVAGQEANDPRRARAEQENAQLPPEMKAMHLYDVDATMEDTELLGMAFHGQQFTLPVYSYHAWWRTADATSAYEYHRRVVKLLQSERGPSLWLFKAPHHNFHLEAIANAYPDVNFVMTHRDPVKAVPSWASIVSTIFPPPEHDRDLHRLGREVSNHLRIGVEQAIEARSRLGEDRFVDVHHRDLIADPMREVRRVYDFIGCELTPSVTDAIEEWRVENRSGAHGTHRYTPEQFGLSAEQLRSDYDFYVKHFDIALEG